MSLDHALNHIQSLGFDTAPIIYFVEANPAYDAIITAIFSRIADAEMIGITSVISVCEVLVHPIRHRNLILQKRYKEILLESSNFYTQSISPGIAETAAELRAKYNLRTPDALQIATALENNCQAFLCNDKNLRRVTDLKVIVLDELGFSS